MRGFPIHPWLTYLYPLVYLFGLVVCCRYRRVSPHMPWLILGFGGLLAPNVILLLWLLPHATALFSSSGFSLLLAVTDPASWVCLIVGLATVLADLRGRSPARERGSDPASEVGSEPAM